MKVTYGVKFFLVVFLIGILTYIAAFGELFGIKIPGVNDIRPGIDINGGIDANLFAVKSDNSKPTEQELETAKTIIGKRLDSKNILDRDLTTDVVNGSVILRIPWKQGEKDFNPQKAIDEIGKTALLTFQEVDENQKDDNGNYKPTGKIIIQGTEVVDARPQPNPSNGSMEVALELSSEGAKKFADATGRLINKPIAIYLDDIFISAPVVSAHITDGKAVITLGQRDANAAAQEARELADYIKSGALPFKLEAKQVNSISPMLGKGALKVSVDAGIFAFALVCLFMIFYYRLPGLVACVALLAQTVFQLLAIAWPHITLTLPGIAGIVLSVGMGVDANIITAERIKEELRSGKTLRASIDAGFERAFSAIFDGNLTVLIASIVLYIFGTGSMLSFAYSLGIGVMLNFVTGVLASRIMIRYISTLDVAKNTWLYGAKAKEVQ